MIVDAEFIECFKTFPMGKSHVTYKGENYRTYRETFHERSKRDLCIAISLRNQETLAQFNLYHTSKTVRLKMSEGSVTTAIDFIKNFTPSTEAISVKPSPTHSSPPVKNVRKRRFFKFLS